MKRLYWIAIILLFCLQSTISAQDSLPEIDIDNTAQVELLGTLAHEKITGMLWSPNGQYLALNQESGVILYRYESDEFTFLSELPNANAKAFTEDEINLFVIIDESSSDRNRRLLVGHYSLEDAVYLNQVLLQNAFEEPYGYGADRPFWYNSQSNIQLLEFPDQPLRVLISLPGFTNTTVWDPNSNTLQPFELSSRCASYPEIDLIGCNSGDENDDFFDVADITTHDVIDPINDELLYRLPSTYAFGDSGINADNMRFFTSEINAISSIPDLGNQILVASTGTPVYEFDSPVIAISRDAKFAVSRPNSQTIMLWDLTNEISIGQFELESPVSQVDVVKIGDTNQGHLLSILDVHSRLFVWNIDSQQFISQLRTNSNDFVQMSIDDDGLFTNTNDNFTATWNLDTGQRIVTENLPGIYSPDEQYRVILNDDNASLIFSEVGSNAELSMVSIPITSQSQGNFLDAWFSPDGLWLAVGWIDFDGSNQLHMFDMLDGPVNPFLFYSIEVELDDMIFSPDGTEYTVAAIDASNEPIFRAYNTESGALLWEMTSANTTARTGDRKEMTYNTLGDQIAYMHNYWDGTIHLIDSDSGEQVTTLAIDPSGEMAEQIFVTDLKYAPNDEILYVAYRFGRLRGSDEVRNYAIVAWDINTAEIVLGIPNATLFDIGSNGDLIYVGYPDGSIEIWGSPNSSIGYTQAEQPEFQADIEPLAVTFTSSSEPIPRPNPETLPLVYDATCASLDNPTLVLGEEGVVTTDIPLTLYAGPDADSPSIGQIEFGTPFLVMGGPICVENGAFWQIGYLDAPDELFFEQTAWLLESQTSTTVANNADEIAGVRLRLVEYIPGAEQVNSTHFTETYSNDEIFFHYPAGWWIGHFGNDVVLRNFPIDYGENNLAIAVFPEAQNPVGHVYIEIEYIDFNNFPEDDPLDARMIYLNRNGIEDTSISGRSARVINRGGWLTINVEIAPLEVVSIKVYLTGLQQSQVAELVNTLVSSIDLASTITEDSNISILEQPIEDESGNLSCSGALRSRLSPRSSASVSPDLILSQFALPGSRIPIGNAQSSEIFDVLAGPLCLEEEAWWLVNVQGTVGYVLESDGEYLVEPYTFTLDQPQEERSNAGDNTTETSPTNTFSVNNYGSDCSVLTTSPVNKRSGPGTNYENVGQTESGTIIPVLGFYLNDPHPWWYLEDESWVRNDVISLTGACINLDQVNGDGTVIATIESDVNAVSSAVTQCSGAPLSRLTTNMVARVTLGGTDNRMRIAPNTETTAIQSGSIPPGSNFTVITGPLCAEGYAWWLVDFEGLVGWTVEGAGGDYWLEPIP